MYQVKWFNKRLGFGFVVDEEGSDFFCHHSDITISGYKYLRAGEYVSGVVVNLDDGKKKLASIGPPVPWGSLMCQVDTRPHSQDEPSDGTTPQGDASRPRRGRPTHTPASV